MTTPKDLAKHIANTAYRGKRRIVALAGPPASGKSTLAAVLAAEIPNCCVVPMDGFHLDNAILKARGLLARKGAPDSFDTAGFVHLVHRLTRDDTVVYPTFDRHLDKSIAGSGVVSATTQTVIVEGNYLLLDHPVWRDLAELWDYSIQLHVPLDVLKQRLVDRWLDHGHSPQSALEKAEANDLPNAALVAKQSLPADMTVEN